MDDLNSYNGDELASQLRRVIVVRKPLNPKA